MDDNKKREDVVKMLAEVKKEAGRSPARQKASTSKTGARSKSTKKNAGARILVIEVDSHADLTGALKAITKREE